MATFANSFDSSTSSMDKASSEMDARVIPLEGIDWRRFQNELIAEQRDIDKASDDDLRKILFGPCKGESLVASGWQLKNPIAFDGNLGDYCLSHFCGTEADVIGNIGHCGAQSIQSGAVIIRGHAGNAVSAYGVSGLVAVYGNAGKRAAVALDGADVLIRGSVGTQAAYAMRSGSLIVGGSAGAELGKNMLGGVIYIRGDVASTASHLQEVKMREPDRMRLGLILLNAGVKSTGREFRVFRPEA
jgi:glutamate synthase domain-containing protein 3